MEIPRDKVRLLHMLLQRSWRGLSSYDLAQWIGCHYDDWTTMNTIIQQYEDKTSKQVLKVYHSRSFTIILEEYHQDFYTEFLRRKSNTWDQMLSGGILPNTQRQDSYEEVIVKYLQTHGKADVTELSTISGLSTVGVKKLMARIPNVVTDLGSKGRGRITTYTYRSVPHE